MSSNEDLQLGQSSEATVAVHGADRFKDNPLGAAVSPVFHSSTYRFAKTVRFAIRIESCDDIIADVEHALAKI